VARLTTMGELAASIAHEINQPLPAIVTNARASLRWLNREEPVLDEARDAIVRIAREGARVRGLRALAQKSGPDRARLDLSDAIQEVLALTRSERQRHGVVLHLDLFTGTRPVFGDRVQLQQVLLNLIMNGIEALSAVTDRPRVLTIASRPAGPGRGAGCGRGHRPGAGSGDGRSHFRSARHDEAARHGHGAGDLPLDHRGPWRAAVGYAEAPMGAVFQFA
jgi:C4-dicarboxylate-specific signal transduction histidine kinase